MAHEETVMELMNQLVIADKHIIGDIMAHRGIYPQEGPSKVNNSYKALNNLVDAGKLVKGDGFFKLPDCKSEYKEHSQLLTKTLAEILKLNYQTKILREPTLKDVGLRPDAIVFLTNGDKGLCFILEVCNNETPEYLMQKIHTWENWNEAKENLSSLFNNLIKQYDIIVASEEVPNGAFECNQYLETLRR